MTPFEIRSEFLSMTDDRLVEWNFILADEVANGPRETVRMTRREMEILRSVMEERGIGTVPMQWTPF